MTAIEVKPGFFSNIISNESKHVTFLKSFDRIED